MFIAQKIDMLLEMLLMEPLLAFIGKPKPVIADISRAYPDAPRRCARTAPWRRSGTTR